MEIIKKSEIEHASELLREGKLIAFPTETVFGFGVVYDNVKSYQRLIDVKRRPPEKPFTLMMADPEDIEKYAIVTEDARKLIKAFMPGQFTIILKAKLGLPRYCVSKENGLGIRVPDDEFVRDLIRKTGKPLLVPSANKSGEPPLNKYEDVAAIFKDEIDGVVVGESNSKIPSTIVIIDDGVHIIREGVITKDQILKVLKGE